MTNHIKNIIKKYNIKLVMPENAKSWQCDWKNCGLCCITEKSDYYENKKCSKFNYKTKECKIYNKRLLDCKIFPYMIIVNQNGINLSPSLLCPGVSNPSELDDLNLLDILTDKEIREFIIWSSENFLGYCADFNLKISNDDVNRIIKLNEEFASLKNIRNLENLKEFILSLDNSDDFDTSDFIRSLELKYIQPNYTIDEKPNPIIVDLHSTKKGHIIFKSKINTKIIKELIIPNNVMFDDLARNAFKEYIELNINRKLELVSLYAFRQAYPNINCESAYISIWVSILKSLYTNLILLVLREDVNIISYSVMREALSMTDSNLHSIILTKPNIP